MDDLFRKSTADETASYGAQWIALIERVETFPASEFEAILVTECGNLPLFRLFLL